MKNKRLLHADNADTSFVNMMQVAMSRKLHNPVPFHLLNMPHTLKNCVYLALISLVAFLALLCLNLIRRKLL